MLWTNSAHFPGMARRIDTTTRDRLRDWLRYYIERSAGTQESFARDLGMTQGSMSYILSGKRDMSLYTLLRLSSLCRKGLDDLVDTWPPDRTRGAAPGPREASPETGQRGRRKAGHE